MEAQGGIKKQADKFIYKEGTSPHFDWCKVLQVPQIRTTITRCGNAKQNNLSLGQVKASSVSDTRNFTPTLPISNILCDH